MKNTFLNLSFISLMLISCQQKSVSAVTENLKEQINKVDTDFFLNKTYIAEEKTPTDPRLGGAPQIRFGDTAGELSYNTGDIMNVASYTLAGNTLTVTNLQDQHTFTLTLKDKNTLIHKDGRVYKYKKINYK